MEVPFFPLSSTFELKRPTVEVPLTSIPYSWVSSPWPKVPRVAMAFGDFFVSLQSLQTRYASISSKWPIH